VPCDDALVQKMNSWMRMGHVGGALHSFLIMVLSPSEFLIGRELAWSGEVTVCVGAVGQRSAGQTWLIASS
jgi:hypothetical protein